MTPQGKLVAVGHVIALLDSYTKIDLDTINPIQNFVYNLDDLYFAFEFALISEGIFNSATVFDNANVLKTRLHGIINSTKKEFFNFDKFISKEDFVKRFFMTNAGEAVQIVDVDYSFVDERFAKIVTKIIAKLFYDFGANLKNRATYPIHIILEEAHRYVHHDNDTSLLGYNIFDRITKEGRKYGVIIGFITQRPSELSETALSQCSNFIAFRLFHPEDLKIVMSISSHVSSEVIEKIKTLIPGNAICFGSSFKLPQLVLFNLPNPLPESTSVKISDSWYE